jgi:hypothetical protein
MNKKRKVDTKWISTNNINDIKKGMFVHGITNTWSQKWTLYSGYENCNCSIYGIVTSDDHKHLTDIKVKKIKTTYLSDIVVNDDDCYLVTDVGTSGTNIIYIFNGTEEEQNDEIKKLI